VSGFAYEPEMNPYWNLIITMSTVGYGDIFPVTHIGRFVAVLAMLCGQFVTSLILLGMSIASGLEMEEQKAFKKLKVIEYHKSQMELASYIISNAALLRLLNKGYKINRFAKIGPFKAMTKLSIQLEILRRRFKENRE
jgi:Ion channel